MGPKPGTELPGVKASARTRSRPHRALYWQGSRLGLSGEGAGPCPGARTWSHGDRRLGGGRLRGATVVEQRVYGDASARLLVRWCQRRLRPGSP